jgi:hypothetical protein
MWPEKVLRQFRTALANSKESDFHGPYNKVLNYYFHPDTGFTVVPQYLKATVERSCCRFHRLLRNPLENKPVLIVN